MTLTAARPRWSSLALAFALAFAAATAGFASVAAAGEADAEYEAWLPMWKKRAESLKVHKEAITKLAEIAKKHPSDYDVQWKAARAFYYFSQRYQKEQEDLKRAAKMSKYGMAFASQAIQVNPNGYDARYWHLMNYVRVTAEESQVKAMRQATDVKKKLEKLIELDPKRWEAYMMLGGLYRVLPGFPVSFGDTKKSLELLKKGESLGTPSAELLLELAETYKAKGDKEKARAYYQKAAKAPGYENMDFELQDAQTYAKKCLSEL